MQNIENYPDNKTSIVLNDTKTKKKVTKKIETMENHAATFEEAITSAKFGKFNVLLALVSILATLPGSIDAGTMSWMSLAAQCDLNLTLNDKGTLNAVIYIGMVAGAPIWGFLSDILGRKKTLIVGLLLDFLFVFVSALSQNLTLLVAAKLFQGLIVIGPFAVLNTYVSEFQMAKYRPIFQLLIGCSMSVGYLWLPISAWLILPWDLDFQVNGWKFHSWNIFLLVSGLPALLSGLILIFFPESPKFLMTCGENEKALNIFKKIYNINTGNSIDTYPIKSLADEKNERITSHRTQIQAFQEGLKQIKPLFLAPYLGKLILMCSVTTLAVTTTNTLRLWLPQIFQVVAEYETRYNVSDDLCIMLDLIDINAPINNDTNDCILTLDEHSIYTNSIIVAGTSIVSYAIAMLMIPWIGKKNMILASLTGGGLAVISLYFATNSDSVLVCAVLFQVFGALSNNLVINITIDMFPTFLRTLSISLGISMARFGATIANFMFPYLLMLGCLPPFGVIGGLLLLAAVLALFFPRTDKQPLK